jgi:hypothetical protein
LCDIELRPVLIELALVLIELRHALLPEPFGTVCSSVPWKAERICITVALFRSEHWSRSAVFKEQIIKKTGFLCMDASDFPLDRNSLGCNAARGAHTEAA